MYRFMVDLLLPVLLAQVILMQENGYYKIIVKLYQVTIILYIQRADLWLSRLYPGTFASTTDTIIGCDPEEFTVDKSKVTKENVEVYYVDENGELKTEAREDMYVLRVNN